MADVLKEWPSRGHSKYAKFLDGKIWRVTLSECGNSTMSGLRSSISNQGRNLGLRVRTCIIDTETLVVQAVPKEEPK